MIRAFFIPLYALILLITGCANHMTLTKQQTTATSNTIFLRPTADRTIYIETRNTSDRPNATLSTLPQLLAAKGFTVTANPDKAHFILQVTTVSAVKAKPGTTLDSLVAGGFGSVIGGGAGAALALTGHGAGFIPSGAALGAGLGFLASKATEDTQFGLIADAQIIECTKEVVEQSSPNRLRHHPVSQRIVSPWPVSLEVDNPSVPHMLGNQVKRSKRPIAEMSEFIVHVLQPCSNRCGLIRNRPSRNCQPNWPKPSRVCSKVYGAPPGPYKKTERQRRYPCI